MSAANVQRGNYKSTCKCNRLQVNATCDGVGYNLLLAVDYFPSLDEFLPDNTILRKRKRGGTRRLPKQPKLAVKNQLEVARERGMRERVRMRRLLKNGPYLLPLQISPKTF